jgi:hypothetical protein
MKQPLKRDTRTQPWRKWYWTARWRNIAREQFEKEPLCRKCLAQGALTPATVCDHVKQHHGDPDLFWNGERQSLCDTHHSSTKQREEKRGYAIGSDAGGRPLDPLHPWNKVRLS